MMGHWSHGHKDGGVACVEGVTEKIFARGMGQAAVRSWLQQARQTGTQSVHGSGDEPKYFLWLPERGNMPDESRVFYLLPDQTSTPSPNSSVTATSAQLRSTPRL